MKKNKTIILGGIVLIIAACVIGLFTYHGERGDSKKKKYLFTKYLKV